MLQMRNLVAHEGNTLENMKALKADILRREGVGAESPISHHLKSPAQPRALPPTARLEGGFCRCQARCTQLV